MFYDGLGSLMPQSKRGFKVVANEHRKHPEVDIQLPQRGDNRSAGYDFYLPCDVILQPGERQLVFTDVKAYMQDDEVLMLYVRSSIGVKKGIVLSNGTGIIDASYYSNKSNDGNIGVSLFNTSDKEVVLQAGERIAQGIFMNYLVADNDEVLNAQRVGGFGSSGN
jgi:dUTP pyrophosphatase